MAPDIAATFATLKRQSDPTINHQLLVSAEAMVRADPANAVNWKAKAAIECRLGMFDAARVSYQCYQAKIGEPWQANVPTGVVTPPNLLNRSGFQLPSLAVLDSFLEIDQMENLLLEAIAAAPKMRDAALLLENNVLDLSKRRTSVVTKFAAGRGVLQHAVEAKLEQFRDDFNIALFAPGTHSIKLTHHGDGGFFLPHRDSNEVLKPGSRALTWLYYFGQTPKRYRGGDLFLFESDIAGGRYRLSSFIKVEPVINRLVIFPSWFFHAVSPLEMFPNASFADGRFAISGHIHVHHDG